MRDLLEEILAKHTGQTVEQVRADIERDTILTADAGQGVRHRRRGHHHPQARRTSEPRPCAPVLARRTPARTPARDLPADFRGDFRVAFVA